MPTRMPLITISQLYFPDSRDALAATINAAVHRSPCRGHSAQVRTQGGG
jgi:hypothetical protein